MSYQQIYPPWYEIASLLYYTIGQDPGVRIMEPEREDACTFALGICVRYQQQADYLRVILPKKYQTGQVVVATHIYVDNQEVIFPCISTKNQRDVANVFCNALRTNPLFRGVCLVPQAFFPIKSTIHIRVIHGFIPSYCSYGPAPRRVSIAEAFAQIVKREYGTVIQTEARFKSWHYGEKLREEWYCQGTAYELPYYGQQALWGQHEPRLQQSQQPSLPYQETPQAYTLTSPKREEYRR